MADEFYEMLPSDIGFSEWNRAINEQKTGAEEQPMSTVDPKFEYIAPTFYRLAISGVIYESPDGDGSWLGKASDGVEVSFGCSIPAAERYLKDNPTPDKW